MLADFFFTYETLINAIGINALLALSLYIMLAEGQLALGQAAFMGIGAYGSALLSTRLDLPFPLVLAAAAALPAFAAIVIFRPTARLSGVYLALSTIGLGEVLRLFYVNAELTGGALGLSGIPARAGIWWIYTTLVMALTALIALGFTRIGRAMAAMRQDETAAAAMGVDLARYKLVALAVSAALAGLAGAFEAHSTSFIAPGEFGFDAAVTILSYALLGGVDSPLGPVIGAVILTLLPELLRPLQDFRLAINGLIIVLAVLFMPRGLLPWRIGRRG